MGGIRSRSLLLLLLLAGLSSGGCLPNNSSGQTQPEDTNEIETPPALVQEAPKLYWSYSEEDDPVSQTTLYRLSSRTKMAQGLYDFEITCKESERGLKLQITMYDLDGHARLPQFQAGRFGIAYLRAHTRVGDMEPEYLMWRQDGYANRISSTIFLNDTFGLGSKTQAVNQLVSTSYANGDFAIGGIFPDEPWSIRIGGPELPVFQKFYASCPDTKELVDKDLNTEHE